MLNAFSRWDFLVTRIILALVAVAVPLLAVGWPLLTWVRGRPLRWSGEVDPAIAVLRGPATSPGAHVDWTGQVAVRLDRAPTSAWIYSLVPGIALSVAVVVVAVLLLRLTGRVQRSEAFVAESVRALRLVALAVVLGWLCTSMAADVASSAVLAAAFPGEEDHLVVTLLSGSGLAVPLAALLIGVVAEAFAQAARLAEDVDGLV